MSWWDDAIQFAKDAWKYDLPIGTASAFGGGLALPGIATPRSVLRTAAAIPAGVLGGGLITKGLSAIPAVSKWMSPINNAPSTMTDRPRPSGLLSSRVPGTGRYDPYTGRRGPGKTVGQVVQQAALKEGIKAARSYGKKRTARSKARARKSRPRATSRRETASYDSPAPKRRRRSTKPPSAKQLAARRRFAAMARARRKR